MATQTGSLLLIGKLGGISFYKQGKKYFAKKATGPKREQLMAEARYTATRQHLSEFGNCSQTGKIIRDSVRMIFPQSDQCYQRLVKLLWQVLKTDGAEKGKRTVAGGLQHEAGRALLRGFYFNLIGEKYKVGLNNHKNVVVQFEIPVYERQNGKVVLKLSMRQITNMESAGKNNLVIIQSEIK